MTNLKSIIDRVLSGSPLPAAEALGLAGAAELAPLMQAAAALRDAGHGNLVSYSRKVFIPLTQLCRDVCHYCTFAHPPRRGEAAYLDRDQVLAIASAGARAGCKEALFTLGDKPELRYGAARDALDRLGHDTTLSYLAEMAALVLKETGLLPHLNPGVMSREDSERLRAVSVSQGIMLESAAERLGRRGGPHFGSPDKAPSRRLAAIAAAGEAAVPFTSGILIGIGETRRERTEALLALRDLHDHHGHIQEIIVQNFRAKPGTRMAGAPEPDLADHLWTIAVARLVFGPGMNIQAPPNLMPDALEDMIAARDAAPPDQINADLLKNLDNFLAGTGTMCHWWADVGSNVYTSDSSIVQDKVGCSILPGSPDVYNWETKAWDTLPEINFAPYLAFLGWGLYVTKAGEERGVSEAAWDLVSHLTGKDISLWMMLYPSGMNPYRQSHFNAADWTIAGYPEAFAQQYLSSIQDSYNHANRIVDLRIPGQGEYWIAAEDAWTRAVAGEIEPQAALDDAAAKWNEITDRLDRTNQQTLYQASLG